jgi:hypothetical protein
MIDGISRRAAARLLGAALLIPLLAPSTAQAQTMRDVLSFLLTNRSVLTGDFERDEAAAAATRDAVIALLQSELGTLPSSSSSAGFTYRLDPSLGASVRSSDSFGPFFAERALTSGAAQAYVGLSYSQSIYREIDGQSLRDGTLVSTASKLRSETQFFDIETLTLNLRTDSVTLQANYGVTDRLDIGAALPFIRLSLNGQRVDNYRGTRNVQATASGTATGPGDTIVRGKYNILRRGGHGVALGAEMRLPTGSTNRLLGTGDFTVAPRLIVSAENDRAGMHANVGYVAGGVSNEVNFNAAGAVAVTPRLTIVAEGVGRRLASVGRLTQVTVPHPRLIDVDTVRLTASDEATFRMVAVGGVKWNFFSTWTLSANVLRPLTNAGLNARWTPTISLDRSFEP